MKRVNSFEEFLLVLKANDDLTVNDAVRTLRNLCATYLDMPYIKEYQIPLPEKPHFFYVPHWDNAIEEPGRLIISREAVEDFFAQWKRER